MKKRGNRDELGRFGGNNIKKNLCSNILQVIATKYTANFRRGPGEPGLVSNFGGNGSKSLRVSVEASLKKLQTSYIDLVSVTRLIVPHYVLTLFQLYVHWWDYTTPIEELMHSLNHLVASGKVLYLGISDSPAWVVRYVYPKSLPRVWRNL